MCLHAVRKPETKKGYAYKVVRIIGRGEFRNYYDHNPTIYRLGETLELAEKQCRWVRCRWVGFYRAAFHLYKEPVVCCKTHNERHDELMNHGTALVLFKYEKAIAQDDTQIVALKVTPIRVLRYGG